MIKTKALATLLLLAALAVSTAHAVERSSAQQTATQPEAKPRPYTYKTPKLDRAKFDALLAHPKDLLIIDVRRPDELTRIGGFPVFLSIQSSELEKHLASIPKDRKIVTVSNHAGRAGAAGDLLAGKGYKVVGAVGAQNYEEEGGTLTRIAPPPPKPESAASAKSSAPTSVN